MGFFKKQYVIGLLAIVAFGAAVWAAESRLKADRLIGSVIQYVTGTIPGSCVAGETRVSSVDNRLKVCTSAGVYADAGIKFVAVNVNCVASPTVAQNVGTVLATSLNRNGGGDCTLVYPAFNNPPACTCTVYGAVQNRFCLNSVATTTTQFRFIGSLDNGGAVDGTWAIICVGF